MTAPGTVEHARERLAEAERVHAERCAESRRTAAHVDALRAADAAEGRPPYRARAALRRAYLADADAAAAAASSAAVVAAARSILARRIAAAEREANR